MTDPDPTPIPRKLPPEDRRRQLIEATIKLIAGNGLARVTLSDVARGAGLSHGLVNFHFKTKDNLLQETLLFLAAEYDAHWRAAVDAAGPDAADQLFALLMADFDAQVFTADRIKAWCAFWGARADDAARMKMLESLCARMAADHGYPVNPTRVARTLQATIRGTWLDRAIQAYPLFEAQMTVMTAATAFFPNHFNTTGRVS